MPRKAKKNLFKTGETQRYKRVQSSAPKTLLTSTESRQVNFRGFPLLIFMILSAFIILTISTHNTYSLSSIALDFSNRIQNIINNLINMVSTAEISLPKITFPKITLPEITLPDLTLTLPRVNFNPLIEAYVNILRLLNPKPFLDVISEFVIMINRKTFELNVQWLFFIFDKLKYLDPRPGIVILSEIFRSIFIIVFEEAIYIIKLLNPLPVIAKTWEFQIFLLRNTVNIMVSTLTLLIGIIYQASIYLSDLIMGLVNLFINLISYIGTAVSNFLNYILNSIKTAVYYVIEFIKPPFNVIAENIKSTTDGLFNSANNLTVYTENLLNQYNNNRPR